MDSPHLVKTTRNRRISRGDSLSSAPSSPTRSAPLSPAAGNKGKRVVVGSDIVDWLLSASAQTPVRIHSRSQATSMWQVLFEDRVLLTSEECEDDYSLTASISSSSTSLHSSAGPRGSFQDKYTLYTFWFDADSRDSYPISVNDRRIAERDFSHCLSILSQTAPDAHLRTILSKSPAERTNDDVSLIFDELIQIQALSELTTSVKQELAHVIQFEFHPKKGTIVFNQGDVGSWWYVIFRGSVTVEIAGKGTVCQLREGEEFGKLALVNNAPRAATIVTAEDNTQFFKVRKEDFNRILVDVEANTIRLKEHGQDVLILLRLAINKGSSFPESGYTSSATSSSSFASSSSGSHNNNPSAPNSSKLVVIAGTPEKMIGYCLESRFDRWNPAEYHSQTSDSNLSHGASSLYSAHLDLLSKDTFFEDFILTFLIFMPSSLLCHHLFRYYKVEEYDTRTDVEFMIMSKRRVVRFLVAWRLISGETFFTDPAITSFVSLLDASIRADNEHRVSFALEAEQEMLMQLIHELQVFEEDYARRGVKKWKADLPGVLQIMTVNTGSSLRDLQSTTKTTPSAVSGFAGASLIAAAVPGIATSNIIEPAASMSPARMASGHRTLPTITNYHPYHNNVPVIDTKIVDDIYFQEPIRPKDEIITRIYYADHTYTTLKYSMSTPASRIKEVAAEKLQIREPIDKLLLVEVKSSGERVTFMDKEISIGTGISVNGRIFISLKDHMDALTPLPEQEGPRHSSFAVIDEFSSLDLAYHLTHYAWILFSNIHERELIFQVFGRQNFNRITSNLDLFLRNFEEVQFWVTTEIVLCTSLSKRVQLLRKFIKTAQICKEYQNLHTFFAIVLGLSNIAVSRLTQTWERLPSKVKRVYSQFETLIDPSRNQRLYRLYLSTLEPPVIPFTPLLLKDMTFAHEGNKTFLERDMMVNFEKMQMLAQAMRTFRFCKSRPLSVIEASVIATNATSGSPLNRKMYSKVENYIKNFQVIDSQKILTSISHSIEYKKQ